MSSCQSKSGQYGFCMFVQKCIDQGGKHLGTCQNGFYFASCCELSKNVNKKFNNMKIIEQETTMKKRRNPFRKTKISSIKSNGIGVTTKTNLTSMSSTMSPTNSKMWEKIIGVANKISGLHPFFKNCNNTHGPSCTSSSSSLSTLSQNAKTTTNFVIPTASATITPTKIITTTTTTTKSSTSIIFSVASFKYIIINCNFINHGCVKRKFIQATSIFPSSVWWQWQP